MRRLRRGDEHGAAAVEMALVMPILVLLVFGIVEFSRAYNAQVTLTHAAREGVRVLAITQDAAEAEATAVNAAPALPGMGAAAGSCNPGQPAELTTTFDLTYSIPLFHDGTITLTGRGVMRCGG